MMMSGCCDYVATTTLLFLLFLIVLICFVESKNLMVKKRFTRDDICKETIKTGKIVQYCPEDVESRRIRTRERMCEDMHDSCSKDSLVYHCLRSRNKLIEVCAPRNFITGNCCVQFNEGLGCIVEDYSVACTECPFHYYSNESITYPSCFQLIKTMAVPGSTIQSTVEVCHRSS
ncbi:uncharacterized protein LOC134262654 [Saccostrea cucullata]|uniref:uncharacterized protein LOC134262654 n=1 Tax=Saccostrea cuccullata TaxID=36930 RepID=UPI002ED5527E